MTTKEPHEKRKEEDALKADAPTEVAPDPSEPTEEQAPDPDTSSDETTPSEPAGTPDEPLTVDDIPTSKSEARERVRKTAERIKSGSGAPAREIAGGFFNRIMDGVDNFMDKWEGK